MLMQDAWSLTAFVNLASRQGQIRAGFSLAWFCVYISERVADREHEKVRKKALILACFLVAQELQVW